MLELIEKGNIFNSSCEFLVNPVNCVGVMGKGLALEFKNKYPLNFEIYKKACDNASFNIGNLLIVPVDNKFIVNFPTKKHWRNKSDLEFIKIGLEELKVAIKNFNIKSIAIPKLGCGLGGLDWNEVFDLIKNFHNSIEDNVLVQVFI
jgi:appr-1-p processing enzyme family protein